jgi:hypothetical protein
LLKWASIPNFVDASDLVKLGVPFQMKGSITDWRRRISARDTLWDLVIKVKVLSATGLLFARTAMLCEH